MKDYAASGEMGDPDIFTDKQCRALDLLIEHKTSKEIARELGISPYTVDQRISLARAKLGVSSRSELAARYQIMRKMPGRSAHEVLAFSSGDQAEAENHNGSGGAPAAARTEEPPQAREQAQAQAQPQSEDLQAAAAQQADPVKISFPTVGDVEYRVGPEVFDGRSGGLWRVGAIVATALSLVITILGLFAIFVQLNNMLG